MAASAFLCLIMDLPPGDYYSPVVLNDTTQPVLLTTCIDEACKRFDRSFEVNMQPGQRRSALHLLDHGIKRRSSSDPAWFPALVIGDQTGGHR